MSEMKQKYDHREVEQGKYDFWLQGGFFSANQTQKEPFTIVIPPPNVTGKLHLGHTWDGTIQDIIIRRKRMQGYNALFLPGMDHAGIATQAKIDQKLRQQGINRYELGREKYLVEAWKWKEEYAAYIRDQWKVIGLSLDYDRERFTLDEGFEHAVLKVFVDMYHKGYIYRGKRIINWDVEAKTAISNIEVEHVETEGALYYITYPFVGEKGGICVATTRPETMFGDTALMVHPEDERYKDMIGKQVMIPLTERAIPVISDSYVDREFGTGAVKVTPAHDPNDYVVGKRHHLEMPLCMNDDGTMNDLAGPYNGMERFEARKLIVQDLENSALLVKVEKMQHNVGHSERTGVIVEPRLSEQWFVSMEKLAENTLRQSAVNFVPERFKKMFTNWMVDIEDWCISRQLWWGHRIPVWYRGSEIYCGLDHPGEGWVQDEDVLDTWFSSALWPFATLGWPENTDDYQRFYPTSVLVTAYDIIFFWVARMIFQAIDFTGKDPFKDCFIHGLIRDHLGRKMSKSLGNGVDPMDVVETHGADALRYFISTNSSPGLDLRYDEEKVESSWNFINKLWNISRYILMNVTTEDDAAELDQTAFSFADRWIIHRLNEMIVQADQFFERYDFGEAARIIYNFTWNDFASWYIEMSKLDLDKAQTRTVLLYVLEQVIKLLHPFMPFVTEDIYLRMNHKDKSISISSWPRDNHMRFPETVANEWFFDLIRKLRQIRNEYNLPYQKKLDLIIECSLEDQALILDNRGYLDKFINPGILDTVRQVQDAKDTLTLVFPNVKAYVPIASLIDKEEELAKLEKAELELLKEIQRSHGLLNNPQFLEKAPPQKITQEKEKYELYVERLETTRSRMKELKG
ncbi:MAG: valine--tRNA ligase [Candidatus Izemoplasmatales bacterium]|nr:valine--tRNA ligase [Candidatus Izemoplasmatales bacterium]